MNKLIQAWEAYKLKIMKIKRDAYSITSMTYKLKFDAIDRKIKGIESL